MPVPPSGSPLPQRQSERFQPVSPAAPDAGPRTPAPLRRLPASPNPPRHSLPHRAVNTIPTPSTESAPGAPVRRPLGEIMRRHGPVLGPAITADSIWRPPGLTRVITCSVAMASSRRQASEQDRACEGSPATARSPGADWRRAQDQRRARAIITGDRQPMRYGLPSRRNPAPGAVASPGPHPGGCAPSTPVGVFAPVPAGQLQQSGPIELAGLCRRHPARGDSHQR